MDVDDTGVASDSRRTVRDPAVESPPSDPTAVRMFDEGDLVAARFRIVAFLGRGGMGEVYEAEDLVLADRVALKTISAEGPFDAGAVDHFRREIHLARRITHPNVCRVHDVVRHVTRQGELLLLSMELLRGETLRQRVNRGERLPLPDVIDIGRHVASALQAMHAASIVHCDLKSSNVMLVADSSHRSGTRAVVMDFGLASHAMESVEGSASQLMGTPAYMAPEQFERGHVGPATDIYALGVILFELVCGRLPFEGDSPRAVGQARLHAAPPRPRDLVAGLPTGVEEVILRCLARSPADRFSSAAEVAAALELPPDRLGLSGRDRSPRWRILAVTAGATAVALIAVMPRLSFTTADRPSSVMPSGGTSSVKGVEVASLRAQSKTALERGDLAAAFQALAQAKAVMPDDPEIDRDIEALVEAAQKVVGRLRELDALNDYLTAQMRRPAPARNLSPQPLTNDRSPGGAAPLLEAARLAVQAAAPAPTLQIPAAANARDEVLRTLRSYYEAIERGDFDAAQELNPKADFTAARRSGGAPAVIAYSLRVTNATVDGTTSRVSATLFVRSSAGRNISQDVDYELQNTGTGWIIVAIRQREARPAQ